VSASNDDPAQGLHTLKSGRGAGRSERERGGERAEMAAQNPLQAPNRLLS